MMRQFKVKVYIDISNPEHVSALNSFLGVIGDQEEVKKPTEVVEKKPRRIKKETVITDTSTTIAETQKEAITKTSIKIEDVRAALSKKVKDHRQAIKDKLTELDAANVTSLDKKHYKDFTTFLKDL